MAWQSPPSHQKKKRKSATVCGKIDMILFFKYLYTIKYIPLLFPKVEPTENVMCLVKRSRKLVVFLFMFFDRTDVSPSITRN